jgi:hypothetical protein
MEDLRPGITKGRVVDFDDFIVNSFLEPIEKSTISPPNLAQFVPVSQSKKQPVSGFTR